MSKIFFHRWINPDHDYWLERVEVIISLMVKLSYAPTNKFLPTVENLTVKKKVKNKFGWYYKLFYFCILNKNYMKQKTKEQIGWVVLVLCIVMGSMSCRTTNCPSHNKTYFYHNRM